MGHIEKLKTQKGILIEHATIPGANHFFENCIDPLIAEVGAYLDRRLNNPPTTALPSRSSGSRA
jgi:alpha/beta superfamily hydrolase